MHFCVCEDGWVSVDLDELWIELSVEEEVQAKQFEAAEFSIELMLDCFEYQPANLIALAYDLGVEVFGTLDQFRLVREHVVSELVHAHDCLLFLLLEKRVALLD